MTLKNKFNVGDKVYYITYDDITEFINNSEKRSSYIHTVETITYDGKDISYGLSGCSWAGILEKGLFKTEEDVLNYAKTCVEKAIEDEDYVSAVLLAEALNVRLKITIL